MKPEIQELYQINEYGIKHHIPNKEIPAETIQYYKENYNIRTDVHKTCVSCQIRQIEKYPDQKDFIIPCKYIPNGLPMKSKDLIKQISDESNISVEQAKKILLATIDPVAWAELMFGFDDKDTKWAIRNYQKEQLRCTSKRIAIREGRRSGKTFCISLKLLYYAFNLKVIKGRDLKGNTVEMGPTIMIVTPYQAQLINIFEEMEKLVKRNVELKQEVTSGTGDNLYIKSPSFKMELNNGASINGFVSGIGMRQDGSGGGTMRGFSADIIYLDEMDMIPKEVLDKVINPILATTPDTMLIATSTPIGKKSKFYEWCLERPDFKEDYHPSSVIPHWEQIKEEVLRESTQESFMAEYMAIFLDEIDGVFKSSWVQDARLDYSYKDTLDASLMYNKLNIRGYTNAIISIGIDWNKNAGTEFFVSGYLPESGVWLALDAVNIGSSEFSAKRWIQELIKLNYKWKPNYIYADEGYGHTIIEDIRYEAYRLRSKTNKTAIEEETIHLPDRLTAFNFSKMVSLKDPVTNEDIKKYGKNFLVENIIRLLEEGLFKFPAEDERLRQQLLNYRVLRRNAATSKPVYGMHNEHIGDHRLDACMLSLGALVLEESIYNGKNNFISAPTYIKKNIHQQNENTDSIIEQYQKAKFGGDINVLNLTRPGLEPDEVKHKPNSSRDLIPKKEFSILEALNNNKTNPNQPLITGHQRRGRFGSKNRSWQ
jgi:hypothetical protein